jgi:hypothetical protein
MIESLQTADRALSGAGDGFIGFTDGNGYGDGENTEDCGDGFLGEGDGTGGEALPRTSGSGFRPEYFLACPDPADLTCLVINTLCRMQP